jgi:transmembrane sensor
MGAAPARENAPPSHDTLEAAAEWFAFLRDSHAGERAETQWRAWLARSEEHRRAWDYVQAAAQRLAAEVDVQPAAKRAGTRARRRVDAGDRRLEPLIAHGTREETG